MTNCGSACEEFEALEARIAELEVMVAEQADVLDKVKANRGGRMLLEGKSFISIRNDEPYYPYVYGLIRKHEMAKDSWTEEDELIYQEETQGKVEAELDALREDAAVGRAIREYLDSGAYETEITITHRGNDDVIAITSVDGETMRIGNGTDAHAAIDAAGLIEQGADNE